MSVRTCIAGLFVLAGVVGAAGTVAAQGLDWELERSFRYFRYPSDEAVHRIAFDLLKRENVAPTPENIEKRLNGGDFWNKDLPAVADRPAHWPASWRSETTPAAIIAKMRTAEGRSKDDVGAADARGWASLLDTRLAPSKAGTCWNSERRLHDNCREHGDYVRPQYLKARVFATGAAPAGNCRWSVEGGSFDKPASNKKPSLQIDAACAEIGVYVTAGADADKVEGRAKVSRVAPDGASADTQIVVRDHLIVGMGDSVTSGEGNPEFGASFSQQLAAEPLFLPRRSSATMASAAQWTDRWCHRSVYSWQIRTMLQVALEDRKRSITGLPYGCSGAEITEGILYTYSGVEFIAPAKPVIGHTAQMGVAYQELCKTYQPPSAFPPIPAREQDAALNTKNFSDPAQILKDVRAHVARCQPNAAAAFRRKVDLMMLAIGVNDVGFARWVSGALLTGTARVVSGGFIPKEPQDGECDRDCTQTERRIARLKARYTVLRQILDERFLKDGGAGPDRVMLAFYPDAGQAANGATCHGGNRGMTAGTFNRSLFEGDNDTRMCKGGLFGGGASTGRGALLAVRMAEDLDMINKFRTVGLNRLAEAFGAGGNGPFVAINDFQSRFTSRGFCASTAADSEPGDKPCLTFAELTTVPAIDCATHRQDCAESLHVSRFFGGEWRPYPPGALRPYLPRTRLFRTPNDVYLLINKRSPNVLDESPLGPLSMRDRASSGAMHPTAEAHSIIATSAAAVAAKKLAPAP